MARTVTEWVGRNDNSMPSDGCKLRIVDRQGGKCALTGIAFTPANKPEFDHIVPLWLGGENRESNIQAITADAHKRKTQAEATVRAKVNATRKKHLLSKKPAKGWNTRFKKKIDGTVIDRRTGEIVG